MEKSRAGAKCGGGPEKHKERLFADDLVEEKTETAKDTKDARAGKTDDFACFASFAVGISNSKELKFQQAGIS